MMKTMKIKFGMYGYRSKRIHIIEPHWKWSSICNTAIFREPNIYKVEWKNICPKCKRLYGKDLKQDIIIQKLKGE